MPISSDQFGAKSAVLRAPAAENSSIGKTRSSKSSARAGRTWTCRPSWSAKRPTPTASPRELIHRDFGRTKMNLKKLAAPVETFTIELRSDTSNKGTLALLWETTEASIPFTVVQ